MDFGHLPADTAHRFRAVAELLDGFESDLPANPKLLDVGGYPGVFARAFHDSHPEWKAVTLDQKDEELTNYVFGSGTRMPFEDESFDAVVTIDVYEHIPRDSRHVFIRELTRVSKHLVILAAPFHHNATASVERLLNHAHETLFSEAHPWLGEHVEFGLPTLEHTLSHWPKTFPVVDVRRSYDLQAWLTWQALSMARKLRGELDHVWERYDQDLAVSPTPIISTVPYRYMVIARKGTKLKPVTEVGTPPPEAGKEVVALAKVFCRLLELTGPESTGSSAKLSSGGAVDQRVREALTAAEQEVARLNDQLARTRNRSPFSAFMRLLGK